MVVEEPKCLEVVIKTEPIFKEIELKNIGFLQEQPTFINCPACEGEALSIVRLEAVTCLQRFMHLTNMCKNWPTRSDINHYCSKCGCFIGRYVAVGCSERCISRCARKKAARDDMSLKTKPKDCAENMQKARERVQAKRALEKADKEAKHAAEDVAVKNEPASSAK